MPLSHRPIPTRYRGIQFRSRLEADWAATLDHAQVRWCYEPDGFVLRSGEWYSPDFFLRDLNVWLEVKGAHNRRISLPGEFQHDLRAELWREIGPRWTAPLPVPMPLVLIGREPAYDPGGDCYDLIVMTTTEDEPAGFVRCPNCFKTTVAEVGTSVCRLCRQRYSPPDLAMLLSFNRGFVRLPRPGGREPARLTL
jgi:hypothetical protein